MGIRSKRSSHILSWERLVYNQGTEKMVLSYKGVGDPVLEVCRKNTSHILSWERPKKGYPPEKRSPVQSVEDVRFVQVAQKWAFRKRGLKMAKLAVLGGVFRYNQRIIT